jgi:GT2 family glycosyltransferase
VTQIIVQSVLYNTSTAELDRLLAALVASSRSVDHTVALHVGDCSAQPVLTSDEVSARQRALLQGASLDFRYTVFGENLGFGRGHNRLWWGGPQAPRLLLINPDALPAPHLLARLTELCDSHPDAGAVEARQIPIEHPKRFDPATRETPWVSGACCLFDGAAFTAAGGFDEVFFLYGEDVDLSWRLRAAARRLYYCPDTFVYHAKRLVDGYVGRSEAEQYHGTLSTLLLRAKYGREALNARTLTWLRANPSPLHRRMLADYERLRTRITPAGPEQQAVASFTDRGEFVDQRWTYPLPDRLAGAP